MGAVSLSLHMDQGALLFAGYPDAVHKSFYQLESPSMAFHRGDGRVQNVTNIEPLADIGYLDDQVIVVGYALQVHDVVCGAGVLDNVLEGFLGGQCDTFRILGEAVLAGKLHYFESSPRKRLFAAWKIDNKSIGWIR